jgi:hypothetical protein
MGVEHRSFRQRRDDRGRKNRRLLGEDGKLSQAEVGQVIGAQKAGDGRTFGEIAVGLGLVDKAAVDSFLASQGN